MRTSKRESWMPNVRHSIKGGKFRTHGGTFNDINTAPITNIQLDQLTLILLTWKIW